MHSQKLFHAINFDTHYHLFVQTLGLTPQIIIPSTKFFVPLSWHQKIFFNTNFLCYFFDVVNFSSTKFFTLISRLRKFSPAPGSSCPVVSKRHHSGLSRRGPLKKGFTNCDPHDELTAPNFGLLKPRSGRPFVSSPQKGALLRQCWQLPDLFLFFDSGSVEVTVIPKTAAGDSPNGYPGHFFVVHNWHRRSLVIFVDCPEGVPIVRMSARFANSRSFYFLFAAPNPELPLRNCRIYEKYGSSSNCNSAFTWFLRGVIGRLRLSDHCLQTLYVLAEVSFSKHEYGGGRRMGFILGSLPKKRFSTLFLVEGEGRCQ